jgi:hypothetical protein
MAKANRVGEAHLTIPALQAARDQPNGEITTTKLIAEMRKRVPLNAEDEVGLDGRTDDRFSQIVRNIKSHNATPGNLIADGYFEAIPRGFRLTDEGRQYLASKET